MLNEWSDRLPQPRPPRWSNHVIAALVIVTAAAILWSVGHMIAQLF